MSKKTKSLILSITSIVVLLFVILLNAWFLSSNPIVLILSIFLISVPGAIYRKALKLANETEIKGLIFFTKIIVPIIFVTVIALSIFFVLFLIETF